MIICVFLITILIISVDYFLFIIFFHIKYNKSALSITTFDGNNQPYHPSVLYRNYNWNSSKYWMAITPYPMNAQPYRDRWECPCIYHSNNGIDWNISSSDTYPLDDLNEKEINSKDFFSDPHLLIKDNRIECWYRLTHHYNHEMDTYILRKTSNDGIHWTKREILIDPNEKDILFTLGDMVRSPAIIWQNKYQMWYVDNKKNIGQRNICFSESEDGKQWKSKIICELVGKEINPWHIDVAFIDQQFYLTIYDLNNLTLWISTNGIQFKYIKTILSPSRIYGSYWSDGLYRSVLVKNENEYLMYFSAYDEAKRCIGLMKGDSPTTLKIVSTSTKNTPIKDYIHIYIENRRRTLFYFKQTILKLCS